MLSGSRSIPSARAGIAPTRTGRGAAHLNTPTGFCTVAGPHRPDEITRSSSRSSLTRQGGFPLLACSEDVALVDLLIATGATLAWRAAQRVVTSGRLDARVRVGFGDTLAAWAADVADSEPSVVP